LGPSRRDRAVHRALLRIPRFQRAVRDPLRGPLSATGSLAPLPECGADLDGSRPVIHVTQGTIANTDYEQLIARTLKALASDDAWS
jgi:hypothetical protein